MCLGPKAPKSGILGHKRAWPALKQQLAGAVLLHQPSMISEALRICYQFPVGGEEWLESNERCTLEFSAEIPSEDFYI